MATSNNSYITLSDLWEILRANIWLFIISVCVALSVAVAYIVVTPPTYTCTARVMIKDDSKGSGIGSSEVFSSMGLVNSKTYIDDEIHVFTTSRLMEEVVERLSLDHIYKLKYRGLRWVDIYHSAPFEVILDEQLDQTTMNFEITLNDRGGYQIDGLNVGGVADKEHITGQFGQSIETASGSFVINYRDGANNPVSGALYSFSKASSASLAAGYTSAVSVLFLTKEASIIVLSITMGSKDKAVDLLNTLIDVYSENWIKDKNAVTVNTTEFIDERLKLIEEELGQVDRGISDFKSENLLPDLGAVAGMNLQASNESFKRQVEYSNQLAMARYIATYIDDNGKNDRLLPTNAGIESQSINTKIERYNELLIERTTLLANSSKANPVIADLTSNIEAVKSLLTLSIDDLITTLELQIENAKKEESASQEKISNNPAQELYLLSASREQKVKEQLYLFLLQKREENQLNQAFTAYNTKVLEWARGSNAPVAPQKNVILLFALAIGFIVPIVLLILRESLNTTVNSKDDLVSVSIPFVGSIPQIKAQSSNILSKLFGRKDNDEGKVIVIDNSRDSLSEAFRVVRTNVDFMLDKSKKSKLLNITSFNPRSGKSFTALNLALSMAMKNSKTIVVDCDFRRGTLSKAAGSPRLGIVNYLNDGKEELDKIICHEQYHPMLDILPMGIMPPNPTELLLTERFETLIAKLQESYDYILFDCPPLEIVPDASIIEKYCDASIFVARAGLFDKRLLPELEELYTSKRLKNICLLLNGVSLGGRYGYGKYGKYGYGKYCYGNNL